MERSQLFDLMDELNLYGMKAAFDETMATAVKRQHEPQRIIGDLLNAEISKKQARSIKYQLTIAKLPLATRRYCVIGAEDIHGRGRNLFSRSAFRRRLEQLLRAKLRIGRREPEDDH